MSPEKFYRLLLISLASVTALILTWFALQPKPRLQAPPAMADSLLAQFQSQKSAIGTKENPQARLQWEWQMLHNPVTGKIPENIRERELIFATNLPKAGSQVFARNETDWQSAGPYNLAGRTRALGIDVTNEQVILAGGVSGGMWRTSNGGKTWIKTTLPNQLHSTTCLVQDTRPGHENTWYYGTGELIGNSARGGEAPYRGDGIYKSTNGGLSWQPLAATSTNQPQNFDPPFDYIFNLKINPANTTVQELYAATFGGIRKSVNGGLSWTSLLADEKALYTDVEVTNTGVVYAALSSLKEGFQPGTPGLFRSANGGLSWQNITPAAWPAPFGRVVISHNPQDPNEVYFLGLVSENGNQEERPTLWRYRHGEAEPWTDLSANLPEAKDPTAGLDLQGGYNMLLKVHPQQPQTLFVGGTNLYRSTSGFTTNTNTTWIGGYSPKNNVSKYPNHHPDQHTIVFYPSNTARAIVAHDGGLSRTQDVLANGSDKDERVKWESLNSGYLTTQFYTVGLDQSQVNDLIIGGMQDNGSYLTPAASNTTTNWRRVLGGDGGYTHVANRGAYYYVSFQESQIYRLTLNSSYNITSFARIDPAGAGQLVGQPYLFINPYVFDPTFKNRMYLAGGEVIYRNRNVTQIPVNNRQPTTLNWVRLEETTVPSSAGSISALSISTQPANILYYGTSQGLVFKATNVDADPEVMQVTNSLFPNGGYVTNIGINPANADEVVVVFSNYGVRSIFWSNNGGESFTDISGNLEQFPDGSGDGPSVRHVEIIPLVSGEHLFLAGTSTGLYSTRQLNGQNTQWKQEGPEIIGQVVVPQIRHRSLDGRVAIATHGNGVYFKNYTGILNTHIDPSGSPFKLNNPSPNPFTPNQEVLISYTLPADGVVRVRVYNSTGQLIKLLLWGRESAGTSEIVWDGKNVSGTPVPPGVYIIRMEYENQDVSKKVVMAR